MKIKKSDLMILSQLRTNSRQRLTQMSRLTTVPVSTIFDRIKQFDGDIIQRHTALIDFTQLGFNVRLNVIIKIPKEMRETAKQYLSKHRNVNTVYKVNSGYDFHIELIFKNIKESEDFLENMDEKLDIIDRQVYYIIDEIKKEAFFADPLFVDALVSV